MADTAEKKQICRQATIDVVRQLQAVPNIKIVEVSAGETVKGAPNGYRGEAVFVLDGRGGVNLMRSPQLMRNLSTQLIKNCNVATVRFFAHRSGWNETFGVFEDGEIKQFDCFAPDRKMPELEYGQSFCP